MDSESLTAAAPHDSAMTLRCSAILLSWRRPYHIPQIVRCLLAVPQICEVICWCNEFPPTREIENSGARIILSERNQVTLGRFLAARAAREEVVFVQDDDLLVHNIPALLETFARGPQIVANLVDDASSRHWTWWQAKHPPWVELGFGSVFPREWAYDLDQWPHDTELLRRKADKIFSVTHPWTAVKSGPEEITRLYHNDRESGRDAHALSNRADHKALTDRAVALAMEWSMIQKTAWR